MDTPSYHNHQACQEFLGNGLRRDPGRTWPRPLQISSSDSAVNAALNRIRMPEKSPAQNRPEDGKTAPQNRTKKQEPVSTFVMTVETNVETRRNERNGNENNMEGKS